MRVILLLLATITLSSTARATELKGVVKSEAGKPLAGVEILTYAPNGPATLFGRQVASSTRRYEVKTSADGSFSIPSHGPLVYFHRADLRPVSKIVDLALDHVEVVMEEGDRTLWKVPACSAGDKTSRTGIGFMLKVPDDVMVKKDEKRFEEGGYYFGYQTGERVDVMINSWESTSLQPAEEILLQSKEFFQRMWMSGGKWGYEYRGTLPDGTVWRRISLRNGGITYQTKTKEAATVFDTMIDAMCFDESAVKW